MSQQGRADNTKNPGLSGCLEGYETPQVAHYMHDMLASLEGIAVQCEMNVLAMKLSAAKMETRQHF